MPDRTTIEQFIATVERGQTVEALRRYYDEAATMQENGEPPRAGLAALIAHEEAALRRLRINRARAASFVVDGDRVAINWVFEVSAPDGSARRLDEIAYQRWSGGKIVEERFFYDPSWLRAPS